MVNKHALNCFDEFTSKFIRSKVRKLIGRAGFTESDRPDLLQEFALDLIQGCENFDPKTATWEAFVVVVCENRYVTILEHRLAEMRSHEREAGSLNRPIKDAEGKRTERGATIPESQHALRTGQHRRSDEEEFDAISDVGDMLALLPPHLRELCERLKHDSISQVARDIGVSTKTVYRRIKRIRQRFERAALRDYI